MIKAMEWGYKIKSYVMVIKFAEMNLYTLTLDYSQLWRNSRLIIILINIDILKFDLH